MDSPMIAEAQSASKVVVITHHYIIRAHSHKLCIQPQVALNSTRTSGGGGFRDCSGAKQAG